MEGVVILLAPNNYALQREKSIFVKVKIHLSDQCKPQLNYALSMLYNPLRILRNS